MLFLPSKITQNSVIPYATWISWFIYLQLLCTMMFLKTIRMQIMSAQILIKSFLNTKVFLKTKVRYLYALIKLNLKVLSSYLIPDLWDSTWVVSAFSLLNRNDLWTIGWGSDNMLMNHFGLNISLWLFFTAGKHNWWPL